MKLSKIIEQLRVGELSNLAIGSFDDNVVTASERSTLVAHINLGLLELHKRLPLRMKELLLLLQPTIYEYHLTYEHAQSNLASTAPKFIEDTIRPTFQDDVLLIDRVFNAVNGRAIDLNQSHSLYSFHTSNDNTLTVPPQYPNNNVLVSYRAKLPEIPSDAPDTYEVELSPTYLTPLLYFVASRFYSSHLDDNGQSSLGTTYLNKFEVAIKQLKTDSLVDGRHVVLDTFHNRGYV